ncbi:MarR family transcriptional regulator [Chelativorans sp. ZYF759]|uniref:MarR family winged helix-turn-helix transcriptional regulator n=1 Tax=Chelativorans sp. ZYF759 TaxID=2692213 RepID=UPI00145DAA70|nr:MarR family transcriptional regulator [Chelativorans sp. ZYF759]NMG40309.1 MarR family transcriptional regulator [Chelativorans sp. ZYF759]
MNVRSKTTRDAAKTSKPAEATQVRVDEIPEMGAIVGYMLRRAQLAVFQDFIESFAKLKLRPAEFSVLAIMARQPGLKQSEIAEKLGIKRANFVSLMDGLEQRGLAERRKSEHDKRSHALHLTENGRQFVNRMIDVWNRHEGRVIEQLGGPEGKAQLIGLLERIHEWKAAPKTK